VMLNSPESSSPVIVDLTPPRRLRKARPAASVYIEAINGNHWNLFASNPGPRITGLLSTLPQGAHGWWHDLHGIPLGRRGGAGIRIGVIDEALERQSSDSPIAHVHNLGFDAFRAQGEPAHRAYAPYCRHSHAVCSILAARPSNPRHYVGVAQGATVYFCAAGSDQSGSLGLGRVVSALDFLVEVHQCDIIVVGAGEVAAEMQTIRETVRYASELGALCFFAAGNGGGDPFFPACYPECLAVGAIGLHGIAPESSWEGQAERRSTQFSDATHFLWHASARGDHVQFLGAGVSIFVTDSRSDTRSVNGTSMATPVVAGTAAVILGRDKTFRAMPRGAERYQYALSTLQEHCWSPFPNAAQFGVLLA
jgi:Subtilase family